MKYILLILILMRMSTLCIASSGNDPEYMIVTGKDARCFASFSIGIAVREKKIPDEFHFYLIPIDQATRQEQDRGYGLYQNGLLCPEKGNGWGYSISAGKSSDCSRGIVIGIMYMESGDEGAKKYDYQNECEFLVPYGKNLEREAAGIRYTVKWSDRNPDREVDGLIGGESGSRAQAD